MPRKGNWLWAAVGRWWRARRAKKGQLGKATWQWVVEMCIIAAGVLVTYDLGSKTLNLGISQLQSVNDGLSSSAAAAVYQQQQDVDSIFVEHPELDRYFSDNIQIPPVPVLTPGATAEEQKAFEEAVQRKARVEAIAFRLLDHFEHLRYQVENGLFEISFAAWDEYIRTSFNSSPVLCELLLKNNAEYDGLGDGSLWKDFAATPCAELGFRP